MQCNRLDLDRIARAAVGNQVYKRDVIRNRFGCEIVVHENPINAVDHGGTFNQILGAEFDLEVSFDESLPLAFRFPLSVRFDAMSRSDNPEAGNQGF